MASAKPSALLDTRRPDMDAFEAKMTREDCNTGVFVAFAYSSDAMSEIGQFFERIGKMSAPSPFATSSTRSWGRNSHR